jgi:2-iminobutanoate/2-iminopropanoate deaminase
MPKTVLNPAGLPPSTAPYSQIIEANGLVFFAGQVGRAQGGPANLEFAAEARFTFDHLGQLLKAAGLGFEDVVRCTVYLVDFDDFAAMDGVFREYFPVQPPTRTTVGVRSLARDCRIEVEATAVR